MSYFEFMESLRTLPDVVYIAHLAVTVMLIIALLWSINDREKLMDKLEESRKKVLKTLTELAQAHAEMVKMQIEHFIDLNKSVKYLELLKKVLLEMEKK